MAQDASVCKSCNILAEMARMIEQYLQGIFCWQQAFAAVCHAMQAHMTEASCSLITRFQVSAHDFLALNARINQVQETSDGGTTCRGECLADSPGHELLQVKPAMGPRSVVQRDQVVQEKMEEVDMINYAAGKPDGWLVHPAVAGVWVIVIGGRWNHRDLRASC